MRTSGAAPAEPAPAALAVSSPGSPVAPGRLTLGTLARLGLYLSLFAALFHSIFVLSTVGQAAGLLCLAGTAALALAALPILLRSGGQLIEPVWFVVLNVAIGVTAKAFYLLFGPEERTHFLLLGKRPDDMLHGALMIVVGLVCLSTGYLAGGFRLRLPRWLAPPADGWDRRRLTAVVGALVAVGLLSFVVFANRIDFSLESLSDFSSKRFVRVEGSEQRGSFGYLRWGASLLEIAFYLVFVDWVATRGRLRARYAAVVAILALLAMAFPFFVSSRQSVFFLFVRMLVVWLCIRGEPRPAAVATTMAIGLVVLGSMLGMRRQTDWRDLGTYFGIGKLMEVTVGGRHFLDLTKTAHVIDAVPNLVEYQYGKTLVTWLVAPVPRSLWPEKPPIGVGIELGHTVFGTPRRSGVTPGSIGELYLNFGPAGVVVGMLVAGFVLRLLHASLSPHFPDRSIVLLYALLVTRLALGTLANSVAGSVLKILQEMLPMLLALWALQAAGGARQRTAGESLAP